ncbi:phosphate transporter [Capsaspora owczarzaki ATCC 30864]|uniref:Phosphate transporter n=1 Tax=Capsaspora owczarzaki (strain ATCC 30864) TaxID=595528 RepID=A0A0D2WQC1_CAPO3|nr:phosphate transporter [Capsaspora owczarzaki ATCC 30864]KJE93083.1 phosphate transporter [Capsaspora owczarzaki ATCC 30864]|eukprot:XP_004363654.1 phosphate transporter [Capsaspora owczarzaki ATCC 30864]
MVGKKGSNTSSNSSIAAPSAAGLAQLDNAGLSWFHIRTVLVAGMGFFCDSYDLFVISLITKCIGRLYYPDIAYYSPERCADNHISNITTACSHKYASLISSGISPADATYHVPSAMPANVDAALKGVALCGTLAGQLIFGYLGDRFGRRVSFGATLVVMVVAALLQGLSFGNTANGVIASLCLFRFALGVGVGGDYPLSATLMSEYSSRSNRGKLVGAVFAMQGIGILAAATVTIIFAAIFQNQNQNADSMWRLILMFGAVPTAATMYARLNLPETPRYTLLVKQNAATAASDIAQVLGTAAPAHESVKPVVKKMSLRMLIKNYGWKLFGCSMCWFLLDIAFYSQNLFQSDVFSAIGWIPKAQTMTITEEVFKTARAQALIALFSTVPGYWVTVFTVEKLGRWWIQLGGFTIMTLCMAILAGDYDNLKANNVTAFVALYALCFFFANFGPNSTTFILPAELFPAQYRSTAHGIAAASGKAGAIIGAFGFAAANTAIGLRPTLAILAAINFAGLLFTFLVPETKGRTLEEITEELAHIPETTTSTPMTGSSSDLTIEMTAVDDTLSRPETDQA